MAIVRNALVLALVAQTAACATLFSGSSQIPVMTNPPGAGVYVNGALVAQTPTTLNLESDVPAHIQIYMPGFRPVQIMQQKTIAGWFWANILFWPGFFVDLATGKYQKYDASAIAIGLVPDQAAPAPAGPPMAPQPPPPPGPAPVQPGYPR